MSKFGSRKFIIAAAFTLTTCLGLFFTDKIDGGQFTALVGIILGAFTAGDVAINALQKRNVE
jgi:hypothetical protein